MPRVVHFEIHADQPERAISFYEEVFGWKFNKVQGIYDYWLIETGDEKQAGINGGLMQREGPVDGTSVIGYVCTIDVEIIDDVLGLIKQQGGGIVKPKHAITGVGWMAYCRDTESNIFGVMQADPSAA